MAVLAMNTGQTTHQLIAMQAEPAVRGRALMRRWLLQFTVLCFLGCFVELAPANGKLAEDQFLNLSIEELMNVKVTTVSRRPQKLTEVASAVFVITQDDIRRSGATSIPDALRMAPGVQVERIDTNKWAVSVRGFNGRFANKLQVLMDGRSVYSPLFSGTLWEHQDTLMEDIERIEVIRGPAAAVWGANAVNGVINIITKKAADTQGTLLSAGGGSFEHAFAGARYGGKINEDTPFRVYAKGFTRDNTASLSGENNRDQWHSSRGGFRVDHSRGIDQFTLQGDVFFNTNGDRINRAVLDLPTIPVNGYRGYEEGGNIRFRWDRTMSDRSSIMFQTYYDRIRQKILPVVDYDAESFDLDFQHRFALLDRHDLTWGANYRLYHNTFFDTDIINFNPRTRTNQLFSGFIRDEIALIPDYLRLLIGTRLDHNDFSGLEVQPNARLMWTPNAENSVWMAVSRAVRTPSRAENDIRINAAQIRDFPGLSILPFPLLAVIQGSHGFNSEKLIAYELGYRHQFSPRASVDIAGFVNDYSQLRDASFGALSLSTGMPIQLLLPVMGNNKASALTYGFEISADWKPTDKWRLQGNYSFLHMDISASSLTKRFDPITSGADKVNPQHQLSLRSNYDLSDKLEANLWLRYISDISYYNIPGYVTMDAKMTYKPVKNLELFVVGQNLFSQNHREFVADFLPSSPAFIPRGIYGGAQWRF
ncbi:TonB-dependent receptor [Nitrosomonas sp. Is24]|uniref:TonB-dependent receptor plug domain-containing protein n=1 Tax=Nitrosomonas sp. Is24 TaxID=3080533 RepID=UPI00294B04E1|nr:TonB-dependent receptor [Nitrosomonas sp. Is24]MDV6342603.1 TonB-dependent receptor [Nitrosomonas sp. Is24]